MGSAGCLLPPSWPLLKGRKRVTGPSSLVAIITSKLLTAKWTKAPLGNVRSGSGFCPLSLGSDRTGTDPLRQLQIV